jgi:hypothetical protein
MPLPPQPADQSWWTYRSKPSRAVFVITTATRWDDRTEQVVVFAEEVPAKPGETEGTLAPATFIDLKVWYNRFDAIDPNAPVEMSVDLNQAGTNVYTPEQLEKMRAILKGAEGG